MEIILIRHGKTAWNAVGKLQGQADPPLNSEGISQADELSQKFSSVISDIDFIYSSERIRAKEVAEKLRGNSETTIKFDNRLNSRNLGEFSGKTLEELELRDPESYKRYISGDKTFSPPNGESGRSVIARSQSFLNDIALNHDKNSKIVVVTHRGNIGILHYLITDTKIHDPMRTIKNCDPLYYKI